MVEETRAYTMDQHTLLQLLQFHWFQEMENGICICQDAQNTIVFKKWKMMDLNRKQNLEEDKISKTVLLYPVQ